MTIAAVAKFQANRRLAVTSPGTLDSLTLTALGLPGKVSAEPTWIAEARRFLGLHEDRDAAKLDKALRLNASEIAWCGAFTAMAVAAVLPSEALPANPLGARNWLKFGRSIPTPQIGAVAVFWRGSKTGWSGHVGFVVGHDKTHLHILGGNQSDKISIARIAKNRLLGLRWPTVGGNAPTAALAMTTITASITTNEA
jgi:uncharacterized protein (TIGR02594 family)